MSSADPNKSLSKKKKRNVTDVKQVNATQKKLGILGLIDGLKPSQAASGDNQPSQSFPHPPPTQLPSNFNKLLPKRKKFECINESNIMIGI